MKILSFEIVHPKIDFTQSWTQTSAPGQDS